jgi:hypothetical protein
MWENVGQDVRKRFGRMSERYCYGTVCILLLFYLFIDLLIDYILLLFVRKTTKPKLTSRMVLVCVNLIKGPQH